MSHDLLANPFAILMLPVSAGISAIQARSREMGGADAAAAARMLLSPRTRLSAELAFLPGTSPEVAFACVSALRQRQQPDLWTLPPVARANVLAHLAAAGAASLANLRDLASLQETARPTAVVAVNQGRAQAGPGVPPASAEACAAELATLAGVHAEALAVGAGMLPDGAGLITDLIGECGGVATGHSTFLRQVAGAWERARSREVSRILECAAAAEARLRDDPSPASAAALGAEIAAFAKNTSPPREAARAIGLQHDASCDAVRVWRTVALDLNNQSDAVTEAIIVLATLEREFGALGDLGAGIARDLVVCRSREAAGDGTQEDRRLAAAIAAGLQNAAAFATCAMADHRTTAASPRVVVELIDSFTAAARAAVSKRPWDRLRGFCIDLQINHSLIAAAGSLTAVAIDEARKSNAAVGMLAVLEKDARLLRALALQRELDEAIRKKRKASMRTILAQLIPLVDAPAEAADYRRALANLRSQVRQAFVRWGIVAVIAIGLAIAAMTSNQAPAPVATQEPSSWTPTTSTAASDDRTETQPSPGEGVLPLPEIRWCRYRSARADGAAAFIDERHGTASENVASFNAAVDGYNDYVHALNVACGSYHYMRTDGAAVDAEVSEVSGRLAAEGRTMAEGWYAAAVQAATTQQPSRSQTQSLGTITPSPSISVPAATPPVPPVAMAQPPAPVPTQPFGVPATQPYDAASTQPFDQTTPLAEAPAFLAGQADRRGTDAWVQRLARAERVGADWWASVRSTAHPPPCSSMPASIDQSAAIDGCEQAKLRLQEPDRRRRTDPIYRAGWNNPYEAR